MKCVAALPLLLLARAERPEDLVTSLPGFEGLTWSFKVYSGFLDVPGPINGYDALKIHYQFHTSQRDPAIDPVAVWHQGGPGGSSVSYGLYHELGAFIIGEDGKNYLNQWSWNHLANMLYLEEPAGSGGSAGYSMCLKGGAAVDCRWDDRSQAEAYAHTLQAFFAAFPEFAKNDLYLTGESYFGQYGPNIAHYILNNEPFRSNLNLKGMALGNACWGGNETCVACNGPSDDKIDVDFFFGKGMLSPKLYADIYGECKFPDTYVSCMGPHLTNRSEVPGRAVLTERCKDLLAQMFQEVGPHNVYDVYDNCPAAAEFLRSSGKDVGWMSRVARAGLAHSTGKAGGSQDFSGGYKWDCLGDAAAWILRPDVQKALHLDSVQPGASSFTYTLSGPASITLYPELVRKLHILIYNGDADACVPYNGNEEWILGLEGLGVLRETSPWTPWYTGNKVAPAGYITGYEVPGATTHFSFATVRLAGHMVPQYQPEAALTLLERFLTGAAVRAEQEVVV